MGDFLISLFGSLVGKLQVLEKLFFMLHAFIFILMQFFQSRQFSSLKPYGAESSIEQVAKSYVAAMLSARI